MKRVIQRKFYFVRHGMTEWNEKQLCQGQRDIELSEIGRLEAKLLSASMKDYSFARICVSPLKRALETATIIQDALPMSKLEVIDDLKERNWGELEGISSEDMYRIEELEEVSPQLDHKNEIEPRQAFKLRILHGINTALRQDDTPLIISHGRVFLSLCELLEIPPIRQIPNTTLIECCPTTAGWQINVIQD